MNPADIARAVSRLREAVEAEARTRRPDIRRALPGHRASAINLAHYIGLRRHDIHRLQLDLAALGLSSLGRSEGHVLDTLRRLEGWLGGRGARHRTAVLDFERSERILHDNARALFGNKPPDRHVYIMVTAPDAPDATRAWADAILRAGTDILRINAAHGTPSEWKRTVSLFRRSATAIGRPVRVFLDLPGPKLRLDIPRHEPGVLRVTRPKDDFGRTTGCNTLVLVPEHRGGLEIPIPADWLATMKVDDTLRLTDAGGRDRTLVVRDRSTSGVLAECDRSLYVVGGLAVSWRRGGRTLRRGRIGPLPERPIDLLLSPGDTFVLRDRPMPNDSRNGAVIVCPEPALIARLAVGERVLLDDAKLVATIESRTDDGLTCRVLRTLKTPIRVRPGGGIAFPDSETGLVDLSAEDEAALAFALRHCDGVEASFVNSASDVEVVADRLRAAAKPGFGLVLKLETRQAMRHLPDILFQALRYEPVGLMIARGDLAVELSFERLAEMQEELLWFGEACHLPVIWATQVLDTLSHSGIPTRAEVTDAAMSMRAECVMLNKGPHIDAAVRMLADIIKKMESHQYKKRSLYRPLAVVTESPDRVAGPAP